MIVSHFLLWARDASPGDRAEAVGALARAFLLSDLSERDRWEAETALTTMLDDPSVLVRRALAEALGPSAEAPRHLVVALASDSPEVAAIVLARSPVLLDCDLVDCAALGGERVQAAIAARPWLSVSASAALAEVGTAPVLAALARNHGAEIAEFSLARMVERHGSDPALREALLVRPDLPVPVAQAIAAALAAALDRFVTGCGWLSVERSGRVTREARERATVALSSSAGGGEDRLRLVQHLRRSAQLTPALILRALFSGQLGFAEAAFAELSGMPLRRVSAILNDPKGGSFRALYGRAGLPDTLRPAFEAAVSALRGGAGAAAAGGLCRRTVLRAMAACGDLPFEDAHRLQALLRRFEAEAARDEARALASGLADRAALAFVLAHAPQALDGEAAGVRRGAGGGRGPDALAA